MPARETTDPSEGVSVYRASTSPWSASEASVDFGSVERPLLDAAGAPVSGWWEPPDVTRWVYWTDPRLTEPDLYVVRPGLLVAGHVLHGELARMFSTTGELLPVRSVEGRGGEWFMYNCTTVFGAVDFERSTIRRYESSQRVSDIRDPVYRSDVDDAAPAIFRQEQLERQGPLFSRRGRDIVVASGATGLEFKSPFGRSIVRTDEAERRPITVAELGSLPPSHTLDERVWGRWCELVELHEADAVRACGPIVAAYVATRTFEWQVGNGGLHQYFFNYPDPAYVELVIEGYETLGLGDCAHLLRDTIVPIAEAEGAWRETKRDGEIATFFDSYDESALPALDDLVGQHDDERVAFVLRHAEVFAR